MVRRALIVTFAIIFDLGSLAHAGPLEDGAEALKRHDYATAMKLWRPLAENGDPTAEFRLGTIYDLGLGVPKDVQEAAHWYELSGTHGNAGAQFWLGSHYFSGNELPQDRQKAVAWLERAANQGDVASQEAVGGAYINGLGVQKDFVKGLTWLFISQKKGGLQVSKNEFDAFVQRTPPTDVEQARQRAEVWRTRIESR